MSDAAACWLRGVPFITLFAPVAGSAVILIVGTITEAARGSDPGGVVQVLAQFVLVSLFAVPFTGPVAGGNRVGRLRRRWGPGRRALALRLRLLGLVLGAACGFVIGIVSSEPRWKSALGLFLPAGTVVGLALVILMPRILGQPYRRLTGCSERAVGSW